MFVVDFKGFMGNEERSVAIMDLLIQLVFCFFFKVKVLFSAVCVAKENARIYSV